MTRELIYLRVEPELKRRLEALARENSRTMQAQVLRMLTDQLDGKVAEANAGPNAVQVRASRLARERAAA